MFKRAAALLLALLVLAPVSVLAAQTASTGYTINIGVDGRPQLTQDAYLPTRLFMDLGLRGPKDLFIKDDILYVADSGNGRVLRIPLDTLEVEIIGAGLLRNPTGVAADEDGRIYVADYTARKAYRFARDGSLEMTFEKPEAASFGRNSSYIPLKVAPGDGGGLYLVNEGSVAGIVQMSGEGDFLGYFAANTVTMSLSDLLRSIFLTEEQQRFSMARTPPAFANIFRGDDRLIYTINRGENVAIKKHAISGANLLDDANARILLDNPVDLAVAPDGRMLAVYTDGTVGEYTADGYFICLFAGPGNRTDRIGLFDAPAGIGVDSRNNIYVLDERRQAIQVFAPTPAQDSLYRAMTHYNNGAYDDSIASLEQVVKYNDTSYLAHLLLGRNYLQKNDYHAAEKEFRTAGDRAYFSQAYWETRNLWLQNNTGWILAVVLVVFLVWLGLGVIRRFRPGFLTRKGNAERSQPRLVHDLLQVGYAVRHPIDNYYNVRVGLTGSALAATVLYVLAFVLLVLFQVARGFIFSVDVSRYSLFYTAVYFFGILALFLAGNFFISSINDGDGTFRQIYIGSAYALAPVFLILPPVILLSNVLSLDESFFVQAAMVFMLAWTLVTVYLMVMQIHDYSFKEGTASLLMTLFFMVVAILVGSLVFLLLKQVVVFVQDAVTEVVLRVRLR